MLAITYSGNKVERARKVWMRVKGTDRQSPIDHPEKFPFEHIEFANGYAANFGVKGVGTDGIGEGLG